MSKKTRSDSVLGNLTPDRQDAIADYARTHSLIDTVAWLRADGVATSRTALSEWLSSWLLEQRFARSGTQADKFRDWLKTEAPDLSEEELDRRAALMFQFTAVEEGDPKTFLKFATARHKAKHDAAKLQLQQQQHALDRDRFEMQFADALRKALTDERLRGLLEKKAGNAEIIAHLRQTYFSDIDALQQSGSVQLPK